MYKLSSETTHPRLARMKGFSELNINWRGQWPFRVNAAPMGCSVMAPIGLVAAGVEHAPDFCGLGGLCSGRASAGRGEYIFRCGAAFHYFDPSAPDVRLARSGS